MAALNETQERIRLIANRNREQYWKRWGPYLSDRQWGTVREDYSEFGNAWEYFSHDQARSRAYRWGEDGLMGISDNHQRLCFAIALWNGTDPILKERLYGLTNSQGNHGEDVKEYYFYLDNTPSHSYMKGLYKYPQVAFPYQQLIDENARRKSEDSRALEFELMDTGVFDEDKYFDVFVEYAKNSPEDILIQITVANRGVEAAELHLAPTLWFRNTWSWGNESSTKPSLKNLSATGDFSIIEADFSQEELSQRGLGKKWLYCQQPDEILYTENESNRAALRWGEKSGYAKDAFNDYIVHQQTDAVNPQQIGTKAAPYYKLNLAGGEERVIRLRLADVDDLVFPLAQEFDSIFTTRKAEADEFYQAVTPYAELPTEMRNVQRQAFAGMLWSKQFFYYVVQDWLDGDPNNPPPPASRKNGRNREWTHLFNEDIISMPDKWEYPWFAAWDLAFHTIPLALIDPDFAKQQLYLFTREWYLHPNGQMPAYEWNFGDVNPPVHAWAAWRVYKIEQSMYGKGDRTFLEQVFQKLSLYFTWWVNRKDEEGNNLFGGGFLGLDNIGVFDRSNLRIAGASIEQSDGTSWMGMFCLNLLKMATELAQGNSDAKVYGDMASKFFQHFLLIAEALNKIGGDDVNIWDEEDNFYYDILRVPGNALPDGNDPFVFRMKLRSMVGLIPLFAVEAIDQETLDKYLKLDFNDRFRWFINNRQDLTKHENIFIENTESNLMAGGISLSLVNPDKLKLILQKMLDESEFFSPYGIRAMSKVHAPDRQPYQLPFAIRNEDGNFISPRVEYEPAESRFGLFGGNSNWRGPVWMPVNFLLIESLQKFHRYLGDDFQVECPTGSGKMMTLWEVAEEISQRLISIFVTQADGANQGERPVYGGMTKFQNDPHWNQYILFYEYFHGDIGAGVGAAHQTGWTGVVAKLIQQYGKYAARDKSPQ
ncbi:MAG: glucosidase [Cyanobacteria bacterium P01_A01_bin.40]